MDSLKEILAFMNVSSRLDLKAVSVSHVLSKFVDISYIYLRSKLIL